MYAKLYASIIAEIDFKIAKGISCNSNDLLLITDYLNRISNLRKEIDKLELSMNDTDVLYYQIKKNVHVEEYKFS